MNIWQGEFPDENTAEDGYNVTAPVSIAACTMAYYESKNCKPLTAIDLVCTLCLVKNM